MTRTRGNRNDDWGIGDKSCMRRGRAVVGSSNSSRAAEQQESCFSGGGGGGGWWVVLGCTEYLHKF